MPRMILFCARRKAGEMGVCGVCVGHGSCRKSRNGAGVRSFTVAASQRGNVLLSIAAVSLSSNTHLVVYHEKMPPGNFVPKFKQCYWICAPALVHHRLPEVTSFQFFSEKLHQHQATH